MREKLVGKRAEPTTEELEFIYSRLGTLNDQEILEEMQDTTFPLRKVPFIRRRRREFNVAKKILGTDDVHQRDGNKQIFTTIISDITNDYGSEEMGEGMQKLLDWKRTHKENWVSNFVELWRSNSPNIKDEDRARRRFSHHFLKIQRFVESGVVNEDFVKINLTKVNQVDFLLKYVEPLDAGINKQYDRSTYRLFEKMYRKELSDYKWEP